MKRMTYKEFAIGIYSGELHYEDTHRIYTSRGFESELDRDIVKEGELGEGLRKSLKSFIDPSKEISVIPVSNPGEKGFVFFVGRGEDEESVFLSHYSFTIGEPVLYETEEDFRKAYEEAISKDYYIEYSDEPKRLTVGFVLYKGETPAYHYIRLKTFIEAFKEKYVEIK